MKHLKYLVVGVCIAIWIPLTHAAQPQAMTGMTAAVSSPAAVVKEGVDQLVGFLVAGGAENPQQVMAFLETNIAPYFDFQYMSQWAVGSRYRFLSPAERAGIQKQLRDDFLGSLARNLAGYRHGRAEYAPARGNLRNGPAVVNLQAYQTGAYPMRLEFRLYRARDGWRVFDVAMNGQSAALYYRNFFRNYFYRQRAQSQQAWQPYTPGRR